MASNAHGALDLPLPKVLLVHGFINSGGMKMQQRRVSEMVLVQPILFQITALRRFDIGFLRHVPTQDDGDFTWEKFEVAYNGELGK